MAEVSVPAEVALDAYLTSLDNRPEVSRQLWTVYPDQTFRHGAPADASCAVCGDPDWWALVGRQAPVWGAHAKVEGHRVRTTETNWSLLRRHVSPLTGLVTRLTGGDYGPLAGWGARHASPTAAGTPTRTGGKGTDSAAARVAAVCEAVERTALAWPDGVPVVRASMAELGPRAIDPRDVMGFSAAQYSAATDGDPTPPRLRPPQQPDASADGEARAGSGATDDAVIRHRVPLPLTDGDVLEWVPAHRVGDDDPRLVPAALVWFGHRAKGPDPDRDRSRIVADSNGVAAGGSTAEAAVYGLLEVIERDAVAMWWHLRIARSALDLAGVDDSYLQRMADYAREHDRDLWLLDLTHDIGVPVVVAVCPRQDGSEVVFGFGAHLDPVAAARAAVAECAQFLMAFSNSPNDRHGLFGEPGRRWWRTRTLATDPHLRPAEAPPQPWPADASGPTDLADLRTLVDRLAAVGLTAYAVPMSRPDVPELTVLRMIVPGARSMFPRFAPGRLYDVPHQLGWTPTRRSEVDVNEEAIFF